MKPGDIVGGRYQILYPLAEGGFGRTYVAQDNHRPSNPQCVVKYLKPNDNNPRLLENAKRLFFEEAKTLEKLGLYGQIPELLAYFAENDNFFLVQEFIKGGTLTKELHPGQTWNEVQICQALFEVGTILEFVHSNGVIHRDIKPDNLIRRDSDSKLVLVDFGAVKDVLARGQGSTTIVAGTSGYMPTEQGWGRPRYSSDIFALGMIGIQAATGLMPTTIPEDPQTGELLWSAGNNISYELSTVLIKMVRYHFKDRYQSALEFLQALSPLLRRYGIIKSGELLDFLPKSSSTILSDVPISTRLASSETDPTSTLISEELSGNSPNPSPTTISSYSELRESTENNLNPPSEEDLNASPTIISELPTSNNTSSESVNVLPTIISDNSNLPQAYGNNLYSNNFPELDLEENATLPLQEEKISSTSISENLPVSPGIELDRTTAQPSLKGKLSGLNYPLLLRLNPQFLKQNILFIGVGSLLLLVVGGFGIKAASQYLHYRQAKDSLEEIQSSKVSQQYTLCIQQADAFFEEFSDLEMDAQTLKSDCQLGEAELAQSAGNYADCIEQAEAITNIKAKAYSTAQDILGNCQLAQAQVFATERSFRRAIESIQAISPEHSSFVEGQGLLNIWSQELIKIAQNEYQKEGEDALSKASDIVSVIPENTAMYSEAQSLIEQWEKTWKADEENFKAAKAAFENNNWNTAAERGRQITTSFWKKKVSSILQSSEANIASAQRARQTSSSPSTAPASGTSSPPKTSPVRIPSPPRPRPSPSAPPTKPRELPRDRN